MKTKALLLIITPLLFASLTGCKKEGDKIHLTYGTEMQVNSSSLKELSNDELLVKARDEKEVFLLATYQGEYSEDCLCWATFKDVISNYMNLNNRLVYIFNAQNQNESLKNLGIEKIDQSTPYLYIFNGEKKLASFSYNNSRDKTIFEDRKANAIKERVNKVVSDPLIYYIHPEAIEQKSDNLLVLFIRNGCGDCKYVLPNVILPYFNSHKLETKLKIVDLQDLYDLQNKEGTTGLPYDEMKDRCQLSEDSNETFGYGKGVVPTMHYYEQGELKDVSIFFNDEVSQKEDGSFYISNSFYSEERLTSLHYVDNVEHKVLKGMPLPSDDVIVTDKGYMFWSQEKAALYHTPLLTAFLDTYCK